MPRIRKQREVPFTNVELLERRRKSLFSFEQDIENSHSLIAKLHERISRYETNRLRLLDEIKELEIKISEELG